MGGSTIICIRTPLSVISAAANKVPDSPWFYEVVDLMQNYPNIYADFSFSGTNSDFYLQLYNYVKTLEDAKAETVLDRSIFGSDFNVHLLKVESYNSYYRMFEQSPFSDDEVHSFVQTNPMQFMGIVE